VTEPARGPTLLAAVQTSPDLATWTTRGDLAFESYTEGQGEIVGNAQFRLDWGFIAGDGLTPSTVTDLPDLGGLYVRVLKEDGTGSVTIGSIDYEPVWWGKMLSPGTTTTVGSGTTMYTAAGIASVFNERTCWMGRAIVKTGPVVFSLAFNLEPFNHWPAGDRSAAAGSVGGVNVYLHDATQAATGNKWTAREIVDYLMACNFKYEQPPTPAGSGQAGLNWAISDPDACLGYTPERFDARGLTLAEVFNRLAGKKRGLSWWVTVSGTTLTVNIASGLAASKTVGTSVIPANPNIWDQLDDTDPFLHPVTIRTNSDEVADEIVVRGSPRRIGITLGIYGSGSPWTSDTASQLTKGWTDAAETACNTYLDTNGNLRGKRLTSYEDAWRRFTLKPTGWSGSQYGGGYMPDSFATVTSASYGTAGLDGTLASTGLTTSLAGLWYRAENDLPCAPGFTALNVGGRQPLVIVAEDYTAGTWFDHSTDWTVRVESSPPAVIIDDGADGHIVRGILRNGRKILVSLALVDFMPFQVMWRRDPADWKAVPPRTKTISNEDLTQEYLLSGMVTGVSSESGGSLTTTASQVTTRDNLLQLRALLAEARAWYEEAQSVATFTDRGVWDSDPAYGPGTLLGNITDGVDPRVIEAMVTTRTVRLETASGENGTAVRFWSTTWETDIVYPDMEAVL
jgi:hypothetical protein